ncbi:MAG: terminase [Gemmiger sp.]|nr:terminase [Gemmiger sp.]
MKLELSEKYRAFLRSEAAVEFLEGTTAAGKTTVGLFKFMLRVAQSDKVAHILSGLDLGTIEKNMIGKELGILDMFGGLVQYYPRKHGQVGLPHLEFTTRRGQKIVYVLGYDNRARWKKALGGQYGCLYIDEINIADMDYVREAAIRCDYLLATLNPDDPGLPVYREYINHARPLPGWEADTPAPIRAELAGCEAKPGWVHWFFTFADNAGLDAEKAAQIAANVPPGTKVYSNKILGLRCRATGLVFDCQAKNLLTQAEAKARRYLQFSCGVDTAYSRRSEDAVAFVFVGITEGHELVILEEFVQNNRDLAQSITPSDIPVLLVEFLTHCREKWGYARDVFIDCADAGTLAECEKYRRREGGLYSFVPSWKKTPILTRIELQQGWMAHGLYRVCETCTEHRRELNSYSWQEGRYRPEDGHDHTINAAQYAWLPFMREIGASGCGQREEKPCR